MDSQGTSSSSPEPQKYELLFSGGAGAVGYQMGYCQGIIETVGRDHLKQFDFHFGGVSAGCAVSAYFFLAIHDPEMCLKHAYFNYTRKFFESGNKKYFGFFTSCDKVYDISGLFWDVIHEATSELRALFFQRYHVIVSRITGLFSLADICVDSFHSREDFCSAIAASCAIPLVTTPGLSRKFRGFHTVDGGITRPIPYKFSDSKKIFINVLPPALNLISKQPDNLHSIDIAQLADLSFPKDYWLWSEQWSDDMFLKGYLASVNDSQRIKATFGLHAKQ